MRLLRSAVFNLAFFGITAALSIYGIVVIGRSPDRSFVLGRLWARLCVRAARLICGIEVRVTGREHLPDGPALIASQHQSAFDTIIWFLLVPRVAYVLKQELTQVPLFGRLALQSGMIAVDRDGGGAAIRALLKRAELSKADQRQIVIFPEGTRSAPGQVQDLQPGVAALATRLALPIIPVRTDSGLCWGRRQFAKRAGVVHVEILPPLPAGLRRPALMQLLDDALRGVGKPVETPSARCDGGSGRFGTSLSPAVSLRAASPGPPPAPDGDDPVASPG